MSFLSPHVKSQRVKLLFHALADFFERKAAEKRRNLRLSYFSLFSPAPHNGIRESPSSEWFSLYAR